MGTPVRPPGTAVKRIAGSTPVSSTSHRELRDKSCVCPWDKCPQEVTLPLSVSFSMGRSSTCQGHFVFYLPSLALIHNPVW